MYKPQIKELKEILNYAGKERAVNIEKFAAAFIKILDNSFAIEQVSTDKYMFEVDKLVTRDN